ncbi:MAG: thioredoxin family protein, partial [Acetobacter sp.]|nr:thioredoxin family protein [Acetobacter sp.]
LQHKNILSDPHVEPFSQQRLETLHASGKSVLVDITAAWCITCLINEHVTLNAPSTQAALAQNNVILLRGDWTRHNPAITAFLHQHGREGIPFYLFVPAVGKEVVLPQILTPSIIIQTITSTSHNTR